jgi:hypothetical protein
VPVLVEAIKSLELVEDRNIECKVDNEQVCLYETLYLISFCLELQLVHLIDFWQVNQLLVEHRSKVRSPTGNFSPPLAPIKHPLQDQTDAAHARVEAGIFMLNEIFPNDIIVHDCMNPKAKKQKDGSKAVISRASLIHLQTKDHRR